MLSSECATACATDPACESFGLVVGTGACLLSMSKDIFYQGWNAPRTKIVGGVSWGLLSSPTPYTLHLKLYSPLGTHEGALHGRILSRCSWVPVLKLEMIWNGLGSRVFGARLGLGFRV